MDTVGYIGVGKMGGPVAEHIQAAGFPMVVYDTNDALVAPFVARGAKRATSPAEVARMSDVIYTALPTMAESGRPAARLLAITTRSGSIAAC